MSRFEYIETSIWSEQHFEELSLEAQHLYLWSFTNPRCNVAGLYAVSRRTMAFESKVGDDRIDDLLMELETADYLLYRDGLLWVKPRVRDLSSKGGNQAKSIARDVLRLPDDNELRLAFVERYRDEQFRLRPREYVSLADVLADRELLDSPSEAPSEPLDNGSRGPSKGPNKNSTRSVEGAEDQDTDPWALRDDELAPDPRPSHLKVASP